MGPQRFENSRGNLLTSQWHEKNSAPVFLLPGPGVYTKSPNGDYHGVTLLH
jgi:hypothetical protein